LSPNQTPPGPVPFGGALSILIFDLVFALFGLTRWTPVFVGAFSARRGSPYNEVYDLILYAVIQLCLLGSLVVVVWRAVIGKLNYACVVAAALCTLVSMCFTWEVSVSREALTGPSRPLPVVAILIPEAAIRAAWLTIYVAACAHLCRTSGRRHTPVESETTWQKKE